VPPWRPGSPPPSLRHWAALSSGSPTRVRATSSTGTVRRCRTLAPGSARSWRSTKQKNPRPGSPGWGFSLCRGELDLQLVLQPGQLGQLLLDPGQGTGELGVLGRGLRQLLGLRLELSGGIIAGVEAGDEDLLQEG